MTDKDTFIWFLTLPPAQQKALLRKARLLVVWRVCDDVLTAVATLAHAVQYRRRIE